MGRELAKEQSEACSSLRCLPTPRRRKATGAEVHPEVVTLCWQAAFWQMFSQGDTHERDALNAPLCLEACRARRGRAPHLRFLRAQFKAHLPKGALGRREDVHGELGRSEDDHVVQVGQNAHTTWVEAAVVRKRPQFLFQWLQSGNDTAGKEERGQRVALVDAVCGPKGGATAAPVPVEVPGWALREQPYAGGHLWCQGRQLCLGYSLPPWNRAKKLCVTSRRPR